MNESLKWKCNGHRYQALYNPFRGCADVKNLSAYGSPVVAHIEENGYKLTVDFSESRDGEMLRRLPEGAYFASKFSYDLFHEFKREH